MKALALSGACVLAGFGSRAALAQAFQPLGFLPTGTHESTAFGTSADNLVVVGAGDTAAGYEAFRWEYRFPLPSIMQPLGDLPGGSVFSVARAVSGDGRVV